MINLTCPLEIGLSLNLTALEHFDFYKFRPSPLLNKLYERKIDHLPEVKKAAENFSQMKLSCPGQVFKILRTWKDEQ